MTLDDELLKKARSAGAQVGLAERQVLLARADYHSLIRRLHLAGGSLREVAEALGVSHQRVQQIVTEAGGSWWQKVWRSRNAKRDLICTFCDRPPSEVAKLIAGPNVYICDGCIALAVRTFEGAGTGEMRAARGAKAACSFCGKQRAGDRPIVAAAAASVCRECLALCRQIIEDRA